MVKKAEPAKGELKTILDNLEERIVHLESKIKLYDNLFEVLKVAVFKTGKMSTVSVPIKAAGSTDPAPIIKDKVAEKVEQGIKDAGGFKETKIGEPGPVEEMNGKYDDPVVMKDPPRWSKGSFVGKKYSECTPDFLKDLAGFLDWAAADDKKNNILTQKGKPRYTYRERDAKRARYWADKIRCSGKINKDTAPTKYTFDD
ncbi:MAG TPA: hypothetical protein VMX17_04640 [Candidatus Glassbacteria bacterium]|nr:hypothetical protein [Candidatus Glassbacteria bacterium]